MSTTDETDYHKDQIIAGKYRIVSLLGRGGMGVVYLVEQAFVGKQLALKTIKKSELSDFTLKRFQAEAKATFTVNHPSIVSVKDYGLIDNQIPFMAMELLDGETIAEFLKDRPFTVSEAADVFIQVCLGLAHAHENGVIHRDIKPSNIMLLNKFSWDTEGSVKIMDFGIAKLTQHDGGEIQALTRTGEIFGSPFYMSPEQCSGEKVGNRSDVYSLGCVLFESLTGKAPFVGDTAFNTMLMHQNGSAPTLKQASGGRDFSPALESIVQKMLAKKPEDRYTNLMETANDLAALKRGDLDSISVYKRAKSERAAISSKITMKKTSYAALLICVAIISSGTTVLLMPDVLAPKTVTVTPKAPVMGQDVKKHVLIPSVVVKHVFVDDMARKSCVLVAHEIVDNSSIEELKGYPYVQRLVVSDTQVTDNGFAGLNQSKILKLDVRDCAGIKSVDNISQLKYLQELNLEHTNISDDDIAKLAKMPMLQKLHLKECNLSDQALLGLAKSNSLRWIDLPQHPPIGERTIAQFLQLMPSCYFEHYATDGPADLLTMAKVKGLSGLERAKRSLEINKKANPNSIATAIYMQQVALEIELALGAQSKTKQNVANFLKAERKALAVAEQAGNVAESIPFLMTLADREAKAKIVQRAAIDAKKSMQAVCDTTMHDEQRAVELLGQIANIQAEIGKREDSVTTLEKINEYSHLYSNGTTELARAYQLESLGWNYYLTHNNSMAAPLFSESRQFFENNREKYPAQYARSVLEVAYTTPPGKDRDALFEQGLKQIEELNFPDEVNLREHYCDSCVLIAREFNKQGDRAEALKYLKRGQKSANRITNDNNTRKNFFAGLIQNQQSGKDI